MKPGANLYCCLCGEPRLPTQNPVESFGCHDIIHIGEYRELKPERWEYAPQMILSVRLWRNGGIAPAETHMCDGCIVVGLRAAKKFVDETLSRLE